METYTKLLNPIFNLTKWITVILLTVMVVFESYEISMRTIDELFAMFLNKRVGEEWNSEVEKLRNWIQKAA